MTAYVRTEKVLVGAVLVAWWLLMPAVGYMPAGEAAWTAAGTFWGHVLYPLSHVNVWHLAGNLWFLYCIRGSLHLGVSLVLSFFCSFLPVWGIWGIGETAGFSGVLCASVGIRWGAWCGRCGSLAAYLRFFKTVLPFVAVGIVIPHVNWCIHLYCLLVGMVYGVATESQQT